MKSLHLSLLSWYKQNGRHDLPWRNTSDIYHIYLSEIMLQQTQVGRVKEEYYPKFLERFPTLKSIADASLDEVLSLWSGLGYYSRARSLHKCAIESDGLLPREFKELQKLSGIGTYTASAICSFGYGDTIAVVDTNIARVIKRFFGIVSGGEKEIYDKAEILLNHKNPRSHNLALMDLGSMVCIPKAPECEVCPLLQWCQGKENPERYTQIKKVAYELMELFYGIYIKDGNIALVKASGGMYKEMLELPSVDPIEENFIGSFKHSYTKYRLTVNLYTINECADEVVWVKVDELEKAPVASLTKKAKKFISS